MQKPSSVSLSWLVLPCLVALAMPSFLRADSVLYSFTSASSEVNMGFSYTWSFDTPTFVVPDVTITQFLSESTFPAGGAVASVTITNEPPGMGTDLSTFFSPCIPHDDDCLIGQGVGVFPAPIDQVGTYTSPQGDTLVVTLVPEPAMAPMILGAFLLFGVIFKRRVCIHGKARS